MKIRIRHVFLMHLTKSVAPLYNFQSAIYGVGVNPEYIGAVNILSTRGSNYSKFW